MRKSCCWLMLALGAGAGCVTLPSYWPAGKNTDAAAATRAGRQHGPVTADQVNESNAHEKAQALQEELEREAHPPAVKGPPLKEEESGSEKSKKVD